VHLETNLLRCNCDTVLCPSTVAFDQSAASSVRQPDCAEIGTLYTIKQRMALIPWFILRYMDNAS
jgi:hypothetical protein